MGDEFSPKKLLQELEQLAHLLPGSDEELAEVRPPLLRKLRAAVVSTDTKLRALMLRLDRVRRLGDPFNPASPDAFAQSIANKLLLETPLPLGELVPFYGSGVYALFYRGPVSAYARISGTRIPIYVGKADPKNAKAATPEDQGTVLFRRLSEHRDSIKEAETHPSRSIRLQDFQCRFLVLDSAWQVVSESYLIRTFQPIWNKEMKICTGIGKHGDSFDTRSNRRSAWDTLHPGRAWAADGEPNKRSKKEIIGDVLKHSQMYLDPRFAPWR